MSQKFTSLNASLSRLRAILILMCACFILNLGASFEVGAQEVKLQPDFEKAAKIKNSASSLDNKGYDELESQVSGIEASKLSAPNVVILMPTWAFAEGGLIEDFFAFEDSYQANIRLPSRALIMVFGTSAAYQADWPKLSSKESLSIQEGDDGEAGTPTEGESHIVSRSYTDFNVNYLIEIDCDEILQEERAKNTCNKATLEYVIDSLVPVSSRP